MVSAERNFLREKSSLPTEKYIFPGVKETLKTLLEKEHFVIVWTNDFLKNVGTSRLGKLRRDLPANEKKRFNVITASASEDKLAMLPIVFENASNNGFSNIVIIDDTREKLERTAQILQSTGVPAAISCQLMWVNGNLPFCTEAFFSLTPERPLLSISTLNDINRFEFSKKTLFLIDFNNTIVDTDKWDRDALKLLQSS